MKYYMLPILVLMLCEISPVFAQAINDPGFEAGNPNPYWTQANNLGYWVLSRNASLAYAGEWFAWFGGNWYDIEYASVSQSVTIPPSSSAVLAFYVWLAMPGSSYESLTVYLDDQPLLSIPGNHPGIQWNYGRAPVDMTAYADGKPHVLSFEAYTYNMSGVSAAFYLDEVSIEYTPLPPDNSAPEDILLSASQVDEGLPPGSLVATLTAVDADGGDSHQFALVPGDGSEHNHLFTISDNQLLTADWLLHEHTPACSIRIGATDNGGATVEKTFTILVNNVSNDLDQDGIPDSIEGLVDTDGDGDPDCLDTDSDSDSYPDAVEWAYGSSSTDPVSQPVLLDLWVDFRHTGVCAGTQANPLSLLNNALALIQPGGRLHLVGAVPPVSSGEQPRIMIHVRLITEGGPVRIGALKYYAM